jgi:hypothetical protein
MDCNILKPSLELNRQKRVFRDWFPCKYPYNGKVPLFFSKGGDTSSQGLYMPTCGEHLIYLGFSFPGLKYFVLNLTLLYLSLKTFVNYAFAVITQRCYFFLSVGFVIFVAHPNRFSTAVSRLRHS